MKTADDAIRAALLASGCTDARIIATQPLSGGCIDNAVRIDFADRLPVVAKMSGAASAPRFEEEAAGLRALHATETVLVPEPLGVHVHDNRAVLLMSYIPSAARTTSDAWRNFGRSLAALHCTEVGKRYGFEIDNHIGSTRQINTFHDDWVEFNRACRFGYQFELARSNGRITGDDAHTVERFIERLDEYIPRQPRPALLHGDLWSGNALPTDHDQIAVIDPAVSIGDGWADIAMMRLFGGFPTACFETYAAHVEDRTDADTRIAIYQIYHLLNHVNIFGSGYVGQTMRAISRFA